MIRANPLLEKCEFFCTQFSDADGEVASLVTKVAGCLWATGTGPDGLDQILPLLVRSYEHGGRRAVSGMVKGWSNAIRALIARDYYDTSHVGYCKHAKNCRFSLRKLGATSEEIDEIINSYGDRGIPPILLLHSYWRVLLPNPSIEVMQSVAPLSNLGRACPLADRSKMIESELSFFGTTGKIPLFKFDLTHVGAEYGRLCRECPGSSKIQINSHSSFDSERRAGGKWSEFHRRIVDEYLFYTVGDLVPTRPNSDLFDVFGNLVLRQDAWDPSDPITAVMYPGLGNGDGLDRRLGLFSLDWAIRELLREVPGSVKSDGAYLTFGSFPPNLSFDGVLSSRVSTLAEEGYKARVITIVKLCVSIIQSVARFFLDPPMRTDRNVKIGLLSKVKLYDFLVHLNMNDKRGVDSYSHESVFYRTALSADLTTATDTPYREGPLSLLRGYVSVVSNSKHRRFLDFAIDVGCSPRVFVSQLRPPDHVHRCGIMMGEGLSGTYLNVMSGIVRSLLDDFMDYFDFYLGVTVEDATRFVVEHQYMIQDYLDDVPIGTFDPRSTQSGDDLVAFSRADPSEVRRFCILLYTILGENPSESTFYSSEYYATFTEEMAIRHSCSLGWVFIDCIKPRLYAHFSNDGIDPVLSRISQISGSLKYIRDEAYILRVCDVVDTIISANSQIRERVSRYKLVPGFPSELGGLNHPISLLDGFETDVPLDDRAMVRRLLNCTLEELWEVKYAWAFDDLPSDEDALEIRQALLYVFRGFNSLPVGSRDDHELMDLHRYPEEMLLDRELFPSFNTYSEELCNVKEHLGMANLDEIADYVVSRLRMRQQLDGSVSPEVNPLIKLRNRREFLNSKTAGLPGDGHDFSWSDVRNLRWRMQSSFNGQCVQRDSFLDLHDFLDLPSLSVPVPTFVGEGRTDAYR